MVADSPDLSPHRDPARGDGPPYLGPVTEAALANTDTERQTPPPLIQEWDEALGELGGFILLWAGASRGADRSNSTSWSSLTINTRTPPAAGENEADQDDIPPTRDPSCAARAERMLSPLAHESRIRIMQALYQETLGSSALSEATGLRGGNLYHHLRELVYAGYVRDDSSGYSLTNTGRPLLVTVTCLASKLVEDRDHEGLVVDTW